MMKFEQINNFVLQLLLLLVLVPLTGVAQDDDLTEAEQESLESDKTGTNPINFSKELRLYNEYSWLNSTGDGNQNVSTLEYRTPIAGGKWQWRIKIPANFLSLDSNNDGFDEVDESGLGDISFRFLRILSINHERKTAWAGGLEFFLNTASEDALGSGNTTLGPQIFYVKFLPQGLFAPGLQWKISVDEDDGRSETDQFLIDLNYLRMAEDNKSWFFTDPQIIVDNENDQEFMVVDLEWGWMMSNWKDLPGHSIYIRPSFGVGADRPTDYSVEFGYKIVGW